MIYLACYKFVSRGDAPSHAIFCARRIRYCLDTSRVVLGFRQCHSSYHVSLVALYPTTPPVNKDLIPSFKAAP